MTATDNKYNHSAAGIARYLRYYNKNKPKIFERKKAWILNNPKAADKISKRCKWKAAKINFDNENHFNECYDIYTAETNCFCCDAEFKCGRDKHLDHCHDCGEPRAVLCMKCNIKNKISCAICAYEAH